MYKISTLLLKYSFYNNYSKKLCNNSNSHNKIIFLYIFTYSSKITCTCPRNNREGGCTYDKIALGSIHKALSKHLKVRDS